MSCRLWLSSFPLPSSWRLRYSRRKLFRGIFILSRKRTILKIKGTFKAVFNHYGLRILKCQVQPSTTRRFVKKSRPRKLLQFLGQRAYFDFYGSKYWRPQHKGVQNGRRVGNGFLEHNEIKIVQILECCIFLGAFYRRRGVTPEIFDNFLRNKTLSRPGIGEGRVT